MAGSKVLKLVRDALRGDRRRAARYRVALGAGVVDAGATIAVTIHDLSLTGALVQGERLPAVGTGVTLTHGMLAERATLAWKDGTQAGLRFERPLAIEQFFTIVHSAQYGTRGGLSGTLAA
ncbi:MAG: PilZ domain-containing protein [Alphaproteobacteria bacterium]|nr:PilZ domain-containing protein [Alphaproteobacteria bacterium]